MSDNGCPVSEEASLVERARRLLDEGESVAAVLELLREHGCSESIPMIQALREVASLGLREAVEIVDAFRRGDARIQDIDGPRLLLLAHPGVREAWSGDGSQIYAFFRFAVMDGHDALTIVPTGRSELGSSFRFWWRLEPGSDEHDPLFGSISGSNATIESLGEALRQVVLLDPVVARHTKVVHVSAERVTCRFELPGRRGDVSPR